MKNFLNISDPDVAQFAAEFVQANWTEIAAASYAANKDTDKRAAIVAEIDMANQRVSWRAMSWSELEKYAWEGDSFVIGLLSRLKSLDFERQVRLALIWNEDDAAHGLLYEGTALPYGFMAVPLPTPRQAWEARQQAQDDEKI